MACRTVAGMELIHSRFMPARNILFKPSAAELKKRPKEHAIRTALQEKILTGVLSAGTALPSAQALATLWESNSFTVHRALTPLVQAGLLRRHKGVGTFVSESRRKLETVGIYYGGDIISDPQHGYAVQLHRLLHRSLSGQNLKMRTWLDPREGKETTEDVLPEILWAIERQEIQAMVAIMTRAEHEPLFARLPIPVVYFGNTVSACNVYFPHREFLTRALRICRDAGRRKVALIASPALLSTSVRTREWKGRRAFELFENICKAAGVATDPRWFHLVDSGSLSADEERAQIETAYRSLLTGRGERADALVIYPDNDLVALDRLLSRKGERLDPSLFVVSHRNEPTAFRLPEGPRYVALSLESVARELVHMVNAVTANKAAESRPGELVESDSPGARDD
jgi:DNA-binding LacI/PurR family transcriptional regulator